MFNLVSAPQDAGVSSVCLNPSRTLLAASSLSGHIHVMQISAQDGTTPSEIGRLQGHSSSVNYATFLDDTTLVTGSDDRCVKVWNAQEGECLHTSSPLKDCINTIAPVVIGGNTVALICGCDDGMVVTLSVPALEVVDRFLGASDTINDAVVVMPNPALGGAAAERMSLLTASEDGAVRVWNLPHINPSTGAIAGGDATGDVPMEDRLINSFDEFTAPVNHILLQYLSGPASPPLLLMASGENIFGAHFDVGTGNLSDDTLHWGGHSDYVRGMYLIDGGVVGGRSGEWQLLSVADDCNAALQPLMGSATGGGADSAIQKFKIHNEMVMALAGTPEGIVATGCEDGSVRLWKMPFPAALSIANNE
jgi:WD40 repeat protein